MIHVIINVSSDKVCFKRFDFNIYEHREPVQLQCIPLRIYESRLLFKIQPKTFRFP